MSLPVAVCWAYSGGRDWLMIAGCIPYVIGGWAFAAFAERIASLLRRWRFSLLLAALLTGVLFAADVRIGSGGAGAFGRGLFHLSYAVVGWRWVFGAVGLFERRFGGTGSAVADAPFAEQSNR